MNGFVVECCIEFGVGDCDVCGVCEVECGGVDCDFDGCCVGVVVDELVVDFECEVVECVVLCDVEMVCVVVVEILYG